MSERHNGWKVTFTFDPVSISDWKQRLAHAFEMLFKKIDEMESEKKLKEQEK